MTELSKGSAQTCNQVLLCLGPCSDITCGTKITRPDGPAVDYRKDKNSRRLNLREWFTATTPAD